MRWLALASLTGVGVVAVMQLVRLLGLVEVGDGFLAAVAPGGGLGSRGGRGAATIVQPELGDAAVAVRKVAVGVSLVSILGAAGGLAWFAADATTAHRAGRPAAAALLTVAALVLPVRDRLERVGRPLAVRRDRQRRPADRQRSAPRPSTPAAQRCSSCWSPPPGGRCACGGPGPRRPARCRWSPSAGVGADESRRAGRALSP